MNESPGAHKALPQVAPIVEAVRTRGDDAVRELTQRFDKAEVATPCVPIGVRAHPRCAVAHTRQLLNMRLPQDLPEPRLDAEASAAFDVAFDNISAFHRAQQGQTLSVETMPGVTCRRISRPIGE